MCDKCQAVCSCNPLKLEVGKKYVTNDKHVVKIYYKLSGTELKKAHPTWEFLGYIDTGEEFNASNCKYYEQDGTFGGGNKAYRESLVREYREPETIILNQYNGISPYWTSYLINSPDNNRQAIRKGVKFVEVIEE